ncbi:unnamed protein product [Protopolystoma xenopodis]|uniref:Uncharacterized protein n=1 Tax=Protopolystoma xenopodis TaxID=117903 RepID=A0A3S5AI80_9PLAT|nr:unnamed protein product [Protopolystoma xenopodis]
MLCAILCRRTKFRNQLKAIQWLIPWDSLKPAPNARLLLLAAQSAGLTGPFCPACTQPQSGPEDGVKKDSVAYAYAYSDHLSTDGSLLGGVGGLLSGFEGGDAGQSTGGCGFGGFDSDSDEAGSLVGPYVYFASTHQYHHHPQQKSKSRPRWAGGGPLVSGHLIGQHKSPFVYSRPCQTKGCSLEGSGWEDAPATPLPRMKYQSSCLVRNEDPSKACFIPDLHFFNHSIPQAYRLSHDFV